MTFMAWLHVKAHVATSLLGFGSFIHLCFVIYCCQPDPGANAHFRYSNYQIL